MYYMICRKVKNVKKKEIKVSQNLFLDFNFSISI